MINITTGTEIDHFRIDRMVASSKTTALYHATDLNTGGSVAIKVPHINMATDATFAERFHREEEIGTELNHPGVMKVIPNPHRTGMYMVLEWVDGRLLRDVISSEAPLPQERAVRIARGILEALDYIHSHGIVHRDLRPEHVFLLGDDRVKLVDFGLAGQMGAKRVTFTNIAELISDGNYMAPEQIAGKRGDARSDLYAVGVMLYEMLSGVLPHGEVTSLDRFNDRLLHDPAPVRKVNPSVSRELEEILRHALERDPLRRYANARDFAHDLAHPESVPLTSRAPSRKEAARRSTAAASRTLILYGLLLIPAVLFLLIYLFSQRK
jgi:eukaryotic-like serine/threonine-protein kinase